MIDKLLNKIEMIYKVIILQLRGERDIYKEAIESYCKKICGAKEHNLKCNKCPLDLSLIRG